MSIHVPYNFGPEKVREDRRAMVERLLRERFPQKQVVVEHSPGNHSPRISSSAETEEEIPAKTEEEYRRVIETIREAEQAFPEE